MDSPRKRLDADDLMEHRASLRAYLRRRVANRQDVDDYVQEVYARALASAPAGGIVNLRGFLLRLASNLVVDRFRADRSRRSDRHVGLDQAPEPSDAGAMSPEGELAARQQQARLEEELQALSPVARDCFILVRVEGLRPAQAARRLGLSEKAVTRHLERTLKRLALALLGDAP